MRARAMASTPAIATLTTTALLGGDSPGECATNGDSDALLKKNIGQCPFGADAVSEDWTEDFGWIWWNPALGL